MNVSRRLKKLEAALGNDSGCPKCSGPLVNEILAYCPDLGELAPQIPSCPLCGNSRADVLLIEERIVAPFEEIVGSDVVK